MATPIIEGIDNEVLVVFSVVVAIVAIIVVQFVYKFIGQNIQLQTSPELHNINSSPNEGHTQEREEVNTEHDQHPPWTQNTATVEDNSATVNESGPQGVDDTSDGMRRRLGPNSSHANDSQANASSDGISIRVKYMENERTILVNRSVTVAELKRLCFPDEVNSGRRVRLIYSGCLLQDDNAAISFYGVDNYSVIHTQISDVSRDQEQSARQTQETDLDVSGLFLPILAVILSISWYGMVYYRHLFSVTSVVILVFVTVAYGVLVHVMMS